jgi:hypothetical protein
MNSECCDATKYYIVSYFSEVIFFIMMLTLYAIINYVMLRMLVDYVEMPSAVKLEHNTSEPCIVWTGFALFVIAITYVLVFLDSS